MMISLAVQGPGVTRSPDVLVRAGDVLRAPCSRLRSSRTEAAPREVDDLFERLLEALLHGSV